MSQETPRWRGVKPGSVMMGSPNRSVLFGGMGPRHEVKIEYDFQISEYPVPLHQAKYLQEEMGAELASESEWELAHFQGLLSAKDGVVEIFPDTANNYWGKICDGSPFMKGSQHPQLSRKWEGGRPNNSRSFYQKDPFSETPEKLEGYKLRMVIRNRKEWPDSSSIIPDNGDNFRLFKEEAIISLIIGIIPSFVWAFFNASPSYIAEGWLNLIIGGLFVGLFSGLFWRPRQPTWRISEGKMTSSNKD